MDTMRSQDSIGTHDTYDSEAIETPPVVAAQERRMHVRAYNYWVSLLGNRSLPSIEDLNPQDMEDFATNSVLLDFSMGMENPAIIYLGSALRDECGITGTIERADQVPPRSLLSRLTDHYLQIIANAAPVGFEAEFTNQRGAEIMYRGILMPFSSDDETIDFIYGVINWKEVAGKSLVDGLDEEMRAALDAGSVRHHTAPIWADGPSATADYEDEEADLDALALTDLAPDSETDFGFEEVSAAMAEGDELDLTDFLEKEEDLPPLELSENIAVEAHDATNDVEVAVAFEDGVVPVSEDYDDSAEDERSADANSVLELDADVYSEDQGHSHIGGLNVDYSQTAVEQAGTDRAPTGLLTMLDAAQRSAAEARDCDVRGRSALYRAISDAYDFSLFAAQSQDDYVMMLEAAGVSVQERSPMTAVVKLVFGASYDKTRIAEYALALDYAVARGLAQGELGEELAKHEGGLKGLVRDMRAARKAADTDKPARRIERAVKKLGQAKAVATESLPFDENGLAVVVARKEADGSITLLAGLDLTDKDAQKVAIAASQMV